MINEKVLLETLGKWRQAAYDSAYANLKAPALLDKVIEEVERMAEEENASDD